MSNDQNANSKKRDANDVLREDGVDELRRQMDRNRTVVPFRSASRPLETADQERPEIRITDGSLSRNATEAENYLLPAGVEIYQRDGKLVRPITEDVSASD